MFIFENEKHSYSLLVTEYYSPETITKLHVNLKYYIS